ncbi:MAG: ArsR family transcriptional regulator, partial [Alphaproteobacteria bacterium]|nr:ArsR family transcriptional regulator [Alphaproteobacteria bacterium]
SRSVSINRYAVELPVMVFLSISVSSHSKEWAEKFLEIIDKHDCILEAHRLTGSAADYQLKIVAKSIDEYDSFQQKLINELDFVQMASSISLRQLKDTRELPIT